MKKLILILFLSLTSLYSQTGKYSQELAAFDTAMVNLMEKYSIPGGQLAVTYKGRLIYSRGFGYADTLKKLSVQPESSFRLASVSKPITAVAMMKLLENTKIRLDDLVFGEKGILNDSVYQDILDPRVKEITIRHLLNHSGGWNRDISGDPMFNAFNIAEAMETNTPADAVTVIRYVISKQMLDFAPGTQYSYSNLGFCILGRVIEKITKMKYEDYLKQTILQPIGIKEMYCGKNLLKDKFADEVNYYDYPGSSTAYSVYDNYSEVPWQYGGFNIEAMDAHGGWIASAQDLCKLLVSIDKFSSKPDILSSAIIDSMIKPSANFENYACGWSVNKYNNWWHIGSLPGTMTEIVRANNEMNWALLFNMRPAESDAFTTEMDNLVWDALTRIQNFPDYDLFAVNEVPEESESSELIYPNPVIDFICLNNIDSYKCNMKIVSAIGKTIYSGKIHSPIDLTEASPGIYFLVLNNRCYKIVKV